jgi:hypothetical protein
MQERRPDVAIRRLKQHLVGKISADEARAFISSAENVAAM